MSTIKDIIEGNLSLARDGYEIERQFIVNEVTGNPEARMFNASIAEGIPSFGQAHPVIGGIYVQSLDVSAIDASTFSVTVRYGVPDVDDSAVELNEVQEASIGVGTTIQGTDTQKDKDGKQLSISITKADGTTDTQVGDVEVQIPNTVMNFSRVESSSPIIKSLEFSGTVNERKVGQFEERTLLCTEISGNSSDNGKSYQVTYSFQYNKATWDATAVYIDSETDKPHVDIDVESGNGVGVFKVYEEKDFSRLNLDFGFKNVPSNGFSFLG